MTLTVKIDERIESALDDLCRREGRTRSDVVRRLIEGYLSGQGRRKPAEIYDEVTGGRAPASDRRPAGLDHSRLIKARLRGRTRSG